MEEISSYRNSYLIEGLHKVDSARVGGTHEEFGEEFRGSLKAIPHIYKEPAKSLGCHFKCSHNGWETNSDIKTADIQCNYFRSGFKPKTDNKLPDLKTGVVSII